MGVFDARLILTDTFDSNGTSLNYGLDPVPSNYGSVTVTDNNDNTLDVDCTISWSATGQISYSTVRYLKAGISIYPSNDDEDIITPYSGVASGKSAFADDPVRPFYTPFYYIHAGPESDRGGNYSIVNPSTGAFDPSKITFTHGQVNDFPGYALPEGFLNIYSNDLMPYYNSYGYYAGNQRFNIHIKIPGRISSRVPDVQIDSWEPTSSGSGILRFKTNGSAKRRYFTKAGSLWRPL